MNPVSLAELYRTVPAIPCKGLCVESCGPVAVTEAERRRLEAAGGPFTVDPSNAACGYLQEGRCTVYGDRPLICRLFGVVESMPCPFGCVPARLLTETAGRVALQRLERIGGQWVWPTYERDGVTHAYQPK